MMKNPAYFTSFLIIGRTEHWKRCLELNLVAFFIRFLNLFMALALLSPSVSYAQVELPDWLNPGWVYEKVMNFHTNNAERFEQTQAKAAAKAAADAKNSPPKPPTTLAPVVTAVPKLNEKYLSAEELKELRKQLKNQK